MTVDISKIRMGDEVLVKFKVATSGGSYVIGRGVRVEHTSRTEGDNDGQSIFVHAEHVVAHTPAPREIKAGDFVVAKDVSDSKRYEVMHIIGTKAWIRFLDAEWLGELAYFQHDDA